MHTPSEIMWGPTFAMHIVQVEKNQNYCSYMCTDTMIHCHVMSCDVYIYEAEVSMRVDLAAPSVHLRDQLLLYDHGD